MDMGSSADLGGKRVVEHGMEVYGANTLAALRAGKNQPLFPCCMNKRTIGVRSHYHVLPYSRCRQPQRLQSH